MLFAKMAAFLSRGRWVKKIFTDYSSLKLMHYAPPLREVIFPYNENISIGRVISIYRYQYQINIIKHAWLHHCDFINWIKLYKEWVFFPGAVECFYDVYLST